MASLAHRTVHLVRSSALGLAAALGMGAVAAADVLTVDDDGPADFSNLADAVAAAANGDVILVEEGAYEGEFLTITKRLTILGRSGGARPELSFTVHVDGAPAFALAGIEGDRLTVSNTSGRVRIDDCWLRELDLRDCGQAVVTGTEVDVGDGYDAVSVTGVSVASLAGCTLAGGDALFEGGRGLLAGDFIRTVTVAGCDVAGGTGHGGIFQVPGDAGNGIEAFVQPVNVRGSSFHLITAGSSTGGGAPGDSIAGPAFYSGVTTNTTPPKGTLVEPPEPYLVSTPALLGQPASIDLFGPEWQPALLLAALASTPPFEVPGWEGGALWLDPGAIGGVFGVVLAGQDTPATTAVDIPANEALLGLAVDLQAIVSMPAGTLHLTNPGQLVARP